MTIKHVFIVGVAKCGTTALSGWMVVSRLDDADARRRFVDAVFGKSVDTPPVPVVFSSTDIAIDEARPDFNDRAVDTQRACLRYDQAQARGLNATTRLGDSLLDHAELDRYLAAT